MQELYELLVARNGTMQDLLSELKKKADLDDEALANVHLYTVQNNKISNEIDVDFPVASLNDYSALLAQRVSKDELETAEGEHLVYVFHYDKDVSKSHGIPFKFLLKSVFRGLYPHWQIQADFARVKRSRT